MSVVGPGFDRTRYTQFKLMCIQLGGTACISDL